MSGNLLILTGLCYVYVALEQYFFKQNFGAFCMYAGYAFANYGAYNLVGRN